MHRWRGMRWSADIALVVVTIIWGSTFVVVKNTLGILRPFVLISARFWAAALALLIAFLSTQRRAQLGTSVIRDGILSGLILAAGFISQTIGLMTTQAGKTAFITGLNVVIVPVFSVFLLRKPPAIGAVIGVILATTGLGFLTIDKGFTFAVGDLWVLFCAVFFALHIIVTDWISSRHLVMAYTLVQMVTVAVVSLFFALLLERDTLVPSLAAVPAVLYLGVVATGLVFGLQTWAQRHTTPTRTALIFVLEPVFAAIFALIFAKERLAGLEWFGGGLIVVGMLVAELRIFNLSRLRIKRHKLLADKIAKITQ